MRAEWKGNGSNFGREGNSDIKADFLGTGCVFAFFSRIEVLSI